ncbi:MAG: heavy metal-associated domain-containing protein [Myxococcota bacterium]
MKKVFKVEGMSCENCVKHVTRAVKGLPGVEQVRVDLGQGQAEVEGANLPGPDAVVAAIEDAGYHATPQ